MPKYLSLIHHHHQKQLQPPSPPQQTTIPATQLINNSKNTPKQRASFFPFSLFTTARRTTTFTRPHKSPTPPLMSPSPLAPPPPAPPRYQFPNPEHTTSSVMVYFTKMKKQWDELTCLRPLPICTCGASRSISEIENEDKLIQFLICLNESYDML
ncbi:hypothetical protein JCGZ_09234 [Jatropha curcas]|uniref:Uncharacterized protein n=1 Tax=Jatropha curcas TaxID=180498 RepID=A0A067KFD8_JATCU|nr:hypothetical protein JCGZ_09234 [Jatropha curcas]